MSEETPKKVWMRVNMAPKRLMEEKLFDDDVQYIRADIVEEMQEALEFCCELLEGLGSTALRGRSALKRLEEE